MATLPDHDTGIARSDAFRAFAIDTNEFDALANAADLNSMTDHAIVPPCGTATKRNQCHDDFSLQGFGECPTHERFKHQSVRGD